MRGHRKYLVRLIRSVIGDPKNGCEIGVWQGETTTFLLRSFPNLTMIAVDSWDDELELNRYHDGGRHKFNLAVVMNHHRVAEQLFRKAIDPFADRCRTLKMTSVEAAKRVGDNTLDFCFVDGSHLYDQVWLDIETWLPKVRDGGLLCGHDYDGVNDRSGWFGVKPAVDSLLTGKLGYNVVIGPHTVWHVKKNGERK